MFNCVHLQVSSTLKATMVLNPVISKLVGKLVVLASASPRRQEILRNAVCVSLSRSTQLEHNFFRLNKLLL